MGYLRPIDAPLARYLHPPSGAGHGGQPGYRPVTGARERSGPNRPRRKSISYCDIPLRQRPPFQPGVLVEISR